MEVIYGIEVDICISLYKNKQALITSILCIWTLKYILKNTVIEIWQWKGIAKFLHWYSYEWQIITYKYSILSTLKWLYFGYF